MVNTKAPLKIFFKNWKEFCEIEMSKVGKKYVGGNN